VRSSAQCLCAEPLCRRPKRQRRLSSTSSRTTRLSASASGTPSATPAPDQRPTRVRSLPFVRSRGNDSRTFDPTAAGVDALRPSLPDALAVFRPAQAPVRSSPATRRHRRSSDRGAELTAADTAPQRDPTIRDHPLYPRLHNVDATPHDHDHRLLPEFATRPSGPASQTPRAPPSPERNSPRNSRHALALESADSRRPRVTDLASLTCTARSNDFLSPSTISPQPSRFDRETLLQEAHRLADAAKQHQQRTRPMRCDHRRPGARANDTTNVHERTVIKHDRALVAVRLSSLRRRLFAGRCATD